MGGGSAPTVAAAEDPANVPGTTLADRDRGESSDSIESGVPRAEEA
jgi:hypothetical protein